MKSALEEGYLEFTAGTHAYKCMHIGTHMCTYTCMHLYTQTHKHAHPSPKNTYFKPVMITSGDYLKIKFRPCTVVCWLLWPGWMDVDRDCRSSGEAAVVPASVHIALTWDCSEIHAVVHRRVVSMDEGWGADWRCYGDTRLRGIWPSLGLIL